MFVEKRTGTMKKDPIKFGSTETSSFVYLFLLNLGTITRIQLGQNPVLLRKRKKSTDFPLIAAELFNKKNFRLCGFMAIVLFSLTYFMALKKIRCRIETCRQIKLKIQYALEPIPPNKIKYLNPIFSLKKPDFVICESHHSQKLVLWRQKIDKIVFYLTSRNSGNYLEILSFFLNPYNERKRSLLMLSLSKESTF